MNYTNSKTHADYNLILIRHMYNLRYIVPRDFRRYIICAELEQEMIKLYKMEKETPAQFRARYKKKARKLGIDIDIRPLSNDELKAMVMDYKGPNLEENPKPPTLPEEHTHSNMRAALSGQKQALAQIVRAEARKLGIEECRCVHMAIPELQEEIENKKQEILREAEEERKRVKNMTIRKK